MTNEHLQEHHPISVCNRRLNQLFHQDLRRLLRNEKNVEDHENLKYVNELIFKYFIGLGRTNVANTFMNVSVRMPNI
jgi:hypothetical protein